jgi:hypothetical protein
MPSSRAGLGTPKRSGGGSSVALYLFFALEIKTLQGAAGRLACLPAAAGENVVAKSL